MAIPIVRNVMVDRGARRLAVWVGISIVVHGAISLSIGFASRPIHRPTIMHAVLRTVMPAIDHAQAPYDMIADLTLPIATPVATPQPDPAPANSLQPNDIPKLANFPVDLYYPSSDVDERAQPLNKVDLVYPLIAHEQRVPGVVTMNLFISEQGVIDKVVIVDSTPLGVFEKAALEAVSQLKFEPAVKNGMPVKNRRAIEVVFDPYERINAPD